MGQGIAQICAIAGLNVLLFDVNSTSCTRALESIESILRKLETKGKLGGQSALSVSQRIHAVDALTRLAPADLIVEAIVENLEVKQKLFAELEEIAGEDAILASNTSSLSITAIASACTRPQRVAGYHFFNPVPLMKVVEVVQGLRTNEETVHALIRLSARIGHTAIRCKDMPGFVVNHAGRALNTEGLRVLQEGVASISTVDAIVREQMGFRMGPLELLDLTGLDVSHPVMESIYRQFYDEPRFRPSPITAVRLAGGMLGRKSKSGFYDYGDGLRAPPSETCAAVGAWESAPVWISRRHPVEAERVLGLLKSLDVRVEDGVVPTDGALIVITPLGEDATTCAVSEQLDATRVVAVDTLFGFENGSRRVIMPTPATRSTFLERARSLFAIDGASVSVIRDSGGFVAQRVAAMIVNTACEIAQQRIASPGDIDSAVRLGLGYPCGPLSLGDRVGLKRILAVLKGLMVTYGDPRYRPSVWLARRAVLNMGATEGD